MAQNTKQGGDKAGDRPQAESVDRDPTGEPTPQDQGVPIDKEDAPKGQPTSDRFHTEQAHKPSETDPEGA